MAEQFEEYYDEDPRRGRRRLLGYGLIVTGLLKLAIIFADGSHSQQPPVIFEPSPTPKITATALIPTSTPTETPKPTWTPIPTLIPTLIPSTNPDKCIKLYPLEGAEPPTDVFICPDIDNPHVELRPAK